MAGDQGNKGAEGGGELPHISWVSKSMGMADWEKGRRAHMPSEVLMDLKRHVADWVEGELGGRDRHPRRVCVMN